MPDQHPPLQKPVLHHAGPRLPVHLQDGRPGGLRIVRRRGVTPGGRRRGVFAVRQIDLHLSFQHAQGLQALVPAAVPHHRHRQGLLQGPRHGVGEVSGIDQINVVGPLGDQLPKDLPQARHGDDPAEIPAADLLVLAEDAPQRAPGEKHRAGAARPRNRRLLPAVEGGARHHRQGGHPACPRPRRLRAQGMAPAWAQAAAHRRVRSAAHRRTSRRSVRPMSPSAGTP